MSAPTTALPPVHAPYDGGTAAMSFEALRSIVTDGIANQPRSLQKRIGPSEIGNPCTHCLAAKLAGWVENRDAAWLPFIGACTHEGFSNLVLTHEADRNAMHTTGVRWLSEHEITVGNIGTEPITGTCDLFDTVTGTVTDLKVVGTITLKNAKRGPSDTYRVQVHSYGRGWVNAGYRVEHVAIWFVPRNAVTLDAGVFWSEPYDEQVATAALDRASQLAVNLAALEQGAGPEARDAWITSLPRDPGCYSCDRYPDRVVAPLANVATSDTSSLAGLIQTPGSAGSTK